MNYGRLASAFSPLVAAVLDPRTQPQHAQLLQGKDFLPDLKTCLCLCIALLILVFF